MVMLQKSLLVILSIAITRWKPLLSFQISLYSLKTKTPLIPARKTLISSSRSKDDKIEQKSRQKIYQDFFKTSQTEETTKLSSNKCNEIIRSLLPPHSYNLSYNETETSLSLLQYMKDNQIQRQLYTYNSILLVMASYHDAISANSLVTSMENGREEGIYPDIVSYNTLLQAYKRSNVEDAPLICEEILYQLLHSYEHEQARTTNIEPDIITYNTVIDAWSKSNSNEAPNRVEFWLSKMQSNETVIRPDEMTYCSVIDSFAQQGLAKKAELVLKQMIELSEQNKNEPKPSIWCFNAVLNGWAKVSSYRNVDPARRAELILDFMEKLSNSSTEYQITPDVCSYNSVLKAYANSSNNLEKALALLQKMISLEIYDKISFNTVLDAISKQRHSIYNRNKIELAMKLYQEMQSLHIKPDSYTITSLLNVYATSGERDAARLAQDFLYSIQSAHPNLPAAAYNAVMSAWARSGEFTAPLKIEQLIYNMKEDASAAEPNCVSYSTLVNAWAKSRSSGSAYRAQEILDQLEEPSCNIHPNVHLYTTVVNAWARSDEPYKAQKAFAILQRAKDYSRKFKQATPNICTYNAVLNACAYTFGDEEAKHVAFDIACRTFDEIRSVSKPNHVTYGTFLAACGKLMDQKKEKYNLIKVVFLKCCKDGQVGSLVLNSLKDAASPELFRELILSGEGIGVDAIANGNKLRSVQMKDLPTKWTRKVNERFR